MPVTLPWPLPPDMEHLHGGAIEIGDSPGAKTKQSFGPNTTTGNDIALDTILDKINEGKVTSTLFNKVSWMCRIAFLTMQAEQTLDQKVSGSMDPKKASDAWSVFEKNAGSSVMQTLSSDVNSVLHTLKWKINTKWTMQQKIYSCMWLFINEIVPGMMGTMDTKLQQPTTPIFAVTMTRYKTFGEENPGRYFFEFFAKPSEGEERAKPVSTLSFVLSHGNDESHNMTWEGADRSNFPRDTEAELYDRETQKDIGPALFIMQILASQPTYNKMKNVGDNFVKKLGLSELTSLFKPFKKGGKLTIGSQSDAEKAEQTRTALQNAQKIEQLSAQVPKALEQISQYVQTLIEKNQSYLELVTLHQQVKEVHVKIINSLRSEKALFQNLEKQHQNLTTKQELLQRQFQETWDFLCNVYQYYSAPDETTTADFVRQRYSSTSDWNLVREVIAGASDITGPFKEWLDSLIMPDTEKPAVAEKSSLLQEQTALTTAPVSPPSHVSEDTDTIQHIKRAIKNDNADDVDRLLQTLQQTIASTNNAFSDLETFLGPQATFIFRNDEPIAGAHAAGLGGEAVADLAVVEAAELSTIYKFETKKAKLLESILEVPSFDGTDFAEGIQQFAQEQHGQLQQSITQLISPFVSFDQLQIQPLPKIVLRPFPDWSVTYTSPKLPMAPDPIDLSTLTGEQPISSRFEV